MEDVQLALYNWSRVLKPKGCMVIVVPDFVLYERCKWPSLFNSDHKASFSVFDIPGEQRHPKFYSTGELLKMARNAGLEFLDVRMEAHGYDWHLLPYLIDQTTGNAMANVVYVFRKL